MQIHTLLATLTLDASNWVSWIIVGTLVGFISGRTHTRHSGGGFLSDIILGLLGACIGWFVLGLFVSGTVAWWGTAIIATIGAIIFVAMFYAFTPLNVRLNKRVLLGPLPNAPSSHTASPRYQPTSDVAANNLPIFVSHSHIDNAWCRVFVDALKRQGCDVWYDEQGLGGGVIWQKQIVQQLQSRPLFVVVLSPDATASQWVDEEIQLAISSRRKIIPVHHRQTVVEGFLTNRQIVDVRGLDGTRAATIVADAARRLVAL